MAQAHLDKTRPYQVRLYKHNYGRRSSALAQLRWTRKGALPFCSSSFFTARLLKVFHHEVRSRLADTGSFAGTGAGWGSPLRTRGVWGWFCVAAGMAGELQCVATLYTQNIAGCERSLCVAESQRCRVGPQWAGRRQDGATL
jgi:hypothetical protein